MDSFLDELRWRGMLHQATPHVEQHLSSAPRLGYIGFDPTAPSLTIGNYVQVMLLLLFQRAGHRPIVLLGGATGRIGDPSGKDAERTLLDLDTLQRNLQAQMTQFKSLLDFEGPHAAIMVDNYAFYSDMNVLDFLRDIGKHLTVNYMMAKESVKKRLETGISFTEFSYQLLQAYDFLRLFEDYGCTVQMGGSDQWGNIVSGIELIRRKLQRTDVHAITTPLLTKSDGSKFGKSEQGNIWLDPNLTSPYQFYQFWINTDDADVPKFTRYFSLRPRLEIEEMEASGDMLVMKGVLAEELTERIHGKEALRNVQHVSRLLFDKSLTAETLPAIPEQAWEMIRQEIPTATLHKAMLAHPIDTLLSDALQIFTSKSEVRRFAQQNALRINKRKVADVHTSLGINDFIHGKYLLLEKGKKNKFLLVLDDTHS